MKQFKLLLVYIEATKTVFLDMQPKWRKPILFECVTVRLCGQNSLIIFCITQMVSFFCSWNQTFAF